MAEAVTEGADVTRIAPADDAAIAADVEKAMAEKGLTFEGDRLPNAQASDAEPEPAPEPESEPVEAAPEAEPEEDAEPEPEPEQNEAERKKQAAIGYRARQKAELERAQAELEATRAEIEAERQTVAEQRAALAARSKLSVGQQIAEAAKAAGMPLQDFITSGVHELAGGEPKMPAAAAQPEPDSDVAKQLAELQQKVDAQQQTVEQQQAQARLDQWTNDALTVLEESMADHPYLVALANKRGADVVGDLVLNQAVSIFDQENVPPEPERVLETVELALKEDAEVYASVWAKTNETSASDSRGAPGSAQETPEAEGRRRTLSNATASQTTRTPRTNPSEMSEDELFSHMAQAIPDDEL